MPFISESLIEQTNEQASGFEALVLAFQREQPELMSYLLSEDVRFLTPGEREYLLYLSLIIWQSAKAGFGEIAPVIANKISNIEDQNWEKLEMATGKTFREKLDVFFDQYPQEDLLAFVEDALVDDEDSIVSKEGRDVLFISLKTVVDVLTAIPG